MEALYLLIPLSILLIFIAIGLFLQASESGQFDDLESPAWRILYDDDQPHNTNANTKSTMHTKEKEAHTAHD